MRSLRIILIFVMALVLLTVIGFVTRQITFQRKGVVATTQFLPSDSLTELEVQLAAEEIEDRVEAWWNAPANISNGDWLWYTTKMTLLEAAIYELAEQLNERDKKELQRKLAGMTSNDELHYHINYILDGRIK